ncbi:hypothetical protein UCD39_03150 [Nitrospirillum sp. BR 11752]|uniref:hypothetical protein n=1 Tax=Nitrospirillum sp. BR 11752 TaxID=3104293 RepID=UPI002EB41A0F|nr:hypothetical protein [Nitrospirillum sp. BR 11752]
MISKIAVAAVVATGMLLGAVGAKAAEELTGELAALYYHKKSGDPLDVAGAAAGAKPVTTASHFDRPEAQKAEEARLRAAQATVDDSTPLVVLTNVTLGEYDRSAGQYTINDLLPGHYLSQIVFGRTYKIGFSNGAPVPLLLPMEEARKVDRQRVIAQVEGHFAGVGDPNGKLDSRYTVLVAISKVTLKIADNGKVLTEFTPSAAAPVAPAKAAADFDVSGLKVGMTESQLTAAAKASFTDKNLVMGSDQACGGGSTMTVLTKPAVGTVCVTYKVADGKATSITVRQVLTYTKTVVDDVRKGLIAKYGPPGAAASQRFFGWGQSVGKRPQDFQLYAALDAVQTSMEYDAGESGTPVLSVTLTDAATLQAKAAPAQPQNGTPHL